jgi:hypothetical protein
MRCADEENNGILEWARRIDMWSSAGRIIEWKCGCKESIIEEK